MYDTFTEIHNLVDEGILGPENCPNPTYWSWPVLRPEELPERFQANYNAYGEIRYFG
jgi:hypothetical protein